MPPKKANSVLPEWLIYVDREETQTSVSSHLKSQDHAKALSVQLQRRITEAAQAAELQASRTLEPVLLFQPRIAVPLVPTGTVAMSEGEAEMWRDYDPKTAALGDGWDDLAYEQSERAQLEQRLQNFGLWNPETLAEELGGHSSGQENATSSREHIADSEHDALLAEIFDTLESDDFTPQNLASEWFPYESKTMFLLDVLSNLPRLPVSDSLLRMFMWVLRELGVKDVPSFNKLRKTQSDLKEKCGVQSIECKSVRGTIFYMNDPRTLVANDWSNPETRKFIQIYPEIPQNGVISEVWHAEKWHRKLDKSLLSPMYDAGQFKHFYINELAALKSQQLIIPQRWVIFRGKVHAEAFIIWIDDNGFAYVEDTDVHLFPASELEDNFFDLEFAGKLPPWSDRAREVGYPTQMPNPDRVIADGDPLYTSLIDYFADDVSGNRSKSWNKHYNAYMTHRNLPRHLLQQEAHIHLLSTSQHATVGEQFHSFNEIADQTHSNPIRTRDAVTGNPVRIRLETHADPSDNPMQSEIGGHIGDKGNFPCRKCDVGGSQAEKEQNEGYAKFFSPGTPRSKTEILGEVNRQLDEACRGVAKSVSNMQTESGVKDAYSQDWIERTLSMFELLQKLHPTHSRQQIYEHVLAWSREHREQMISPFFRAKGLNPPQDTPVEILHTILLGIVKYIWYYSHSKWKDPEKKLFSERLQGTDTTGLSIQPIRANYIMQYANSLIGRQLKTLVQTALFHVHDLVDEPHFAIWHAVGQLAALLWVPEIDDINEYCTDLEVAVGNVLDAFGIVDPSKMVMKIKLHLLTHLPEDARRFGPLIGVATETHECYNAVFRYASIHSNHLAPSRDIAKYLAEQEDMKHRLTGGWWKNKGPNGTDLWCQAGSGVRNFRLNQPCLQSVIGWTSPNTTIPGTVKLESLKRVSGQPAPKRVSLPLNRTSACNALNIPSYDPKSCWFLCREVTAQTGDLCRVESWVFAESPLDPSPICGRVLHILQAEDGQSAIVVLDIFQVGALHPLFKMPTLRRRFNEQSKLIVSSQAVLFTFNVQHDCRSAQCTASVIQPVIQERSVTGQLKYVWKHNTDNDVGFIINTSAFHNAHILRRILPRSLIAPTPLFSDREKRHHEFATQFRESRSEKRDAQQEKRAQKRKAKDMEAELPEQGPAQRAKT